MAIGLRPTQGDENHRCRQPRVSGDPRQSNGYYGFTFRVADDRGKTLRGIINGMLPYDVRKAANTNPGVRYKG